MPLWAPTAQEKVPWPTPWLVIPKYEVEGGDVLMGDENCTWRWRPDERAQAGLFLAFPISHGSFPGVSMANFLRTAVNAVHGTEDANGKKGVSYHRIP